MVDNSKLASECPDCLPDSQKNGFVARYHFYFELGEGRIHSYGVAKWIIDGLNGREHPIGTNSAISAAEFSTERLAQLGNDRIRELNPRLITKVYRIALSPPEH